MKNKNVLVLLFAILILLFPQLNVEAGSVNKITWTTIESTTQLITLADTTVYNGCFENTSILKTMQLIPAGNIVNINGYCKTKADGLWYKVTFNGITGYCQRNTLGPVTDWTQVKKLLETASNGNLEIFSDEQFISFLAGTLCPPTLTPMQKAKNVHDYLCMNMIFDDSLTYLTTHDALYRGTGVCQAYANAFCDIMNRAGITTEFIGGVAINSDGQLEDHAWNRCLVGNTYYYVDTTWDDEGDFAGTKLFWTTDKTFSQSHVETCIDPYRKH